MISKIVKESLDKHEDEFIELYHLVEDYSTQECKKEGDNYIFTTKSYFRVPYKEMVAQLFEIVENHDEDLIFDLRDKIEFYGKILTEILSKEMK